MANNTQEAELMKNLSVQERRKLMRRLEQGSPKKAPSNKHTSAGVTKSHNVSPKPFVVGTASSGIQSVDSKPKSSVLNRWPNNNSSSNFVPGRNSFQGDSAKATKPDSVVMPKLNPEHVNMFKAQEANKVAKGRAPPLPKPSNPKPLASSNGSNTPPKPAANKFVPGKNRSNSPSAPTQQSRKPPVPVSKPVEEPLLKPSQANKNAAKPVANVPKPKTPPAVARINAANNGNAVKWAPVNPTPQPSTVSPPPSKPQPQSAAAPAKPPLPWQRQGKPLSKEKSTSPGSPPTAVVAPMQERVSVPVENKPKPKSPPVGRDRAVSSPVLPLKAEKNVVSYKSSSDDVVLPPLNQSPAANPHQSPPLQQKVKPRAMSELPQPKAPSSKADGKPKKLGHNFEPYELKDWLNWCDACGRVILSLFGKCVHCTKCNMVCHGKCALTVSLTCEADQQKARSLTLNDSSALKMYKTIIQETKDEATLKEFNTIQRVISLEEIQQKIEDFNQTVKGSQQMTLQEDGTTFRGFIRVTMNLTRPVSVVDAAKTSRKPSKKSSFYIDKGAVKALHLTSDTTAAQVVEALLNKYNIADNPMKFALFEKQHREEGHVILRKMLPKERPLFLRLLWGNGSSEKKGFILQENESREIHWESFSVGELQMFIKILDKEENDYITEIRRKFKDRAQDIKNALEYRNKKG